jgi:hypothetical protein
MTSIAGTWALSHGLTTAPDGTALPPPYGAEKPMGRVVLTAEGRMMAVLCDGRKDLPPGAVREYTSYCGDYTFDGKTLITRVDAASDASRMGTDQVRQVTFDGDFMVLRPADRTRDGQVEVRLLYWRKISDLA